jgi:hypothetical protein
MADPWRSGVDPAVRILRIVVVLAFTGVAVIVALDPSRDTIEVGTISGIFVGAVMVLLGYEGFLKLWRRNGE